jgi:predicted nucleic acid-binding protein
MNEQLKLNMKVQEKQTNCRFRRNVDVNVFIHAWNSAHKIVFLTDWILLMSLQLREKYSVCYTDNTLLGGNKSSSLC